MFSIHQIDTVPESLECFHLSYLFTIQTLSYICTHRTARVHIHMYTCMCCPYTYHIYSLLQMVSVERVIAYSKLEPEAPLETLPSGEKLPEEWPQHGGIRVQQMNFRYAKDTPYILKDISVDIKPGEKVGYVHAEPLRSYLANHLQQVAFNRT